MNTDTLRPNDMLDDVFLNHNHGKEKPVTGTTPSSNGTHHRLSGVLAHQDPAPARPSLVGLLDQLADLDPEAIDAELAALNRRVAMLMALRAGIAPASLPAVEPVRAAAPKAPSPARKGNAPAGGKTAEMQQRVVLHIHCHGPARTMDLAKALDTSAKGISRFLNKQWVRKGPSHNDPWRLTDAGKREAEKLSPAS